MLSILYHDYFVKYCEINLHVFCNIISYFILVKCNSIVYLYNFFMHLSVNWHMNWFCNLVIVNNEINTYVKEYLWNFSSFTWTIAKVWFIFNQTRGIKIECVIYHTQYFGRISKPGEEVIVILSQFMT